MSCTNSACGALAACQGRLERAPRGADETAADSSYETGADAVDDEFASEAGRTEAMEDLAIEAQERFDEAMADATTDEERIRAYEEFEQQRLDLNEMAESESTAEDGDAFGPPPAP